PSIAEIEKCKTGKIPLPLPPDYLKRKGYRLPTEAEWEYACRAGTLTSRYYGSSPELLPRYAWYLNTSRDRTWPVGQKRPNDLGLFDMHGNVWNWCQERRRRYYPPGSREEPVRDDEETRSISNRLTLVLRGTAFNVQPFVVRAATRYNAPPTSRGPGP